MKLRNSMAVLALAASIFANNAADAQERTLRSLGGSDTVFVWKDKKSHNEALTLIQAGVHRSNPALLIALMACMVPDGTKAIITDAGFATHDIMVTSGQFAGCRGNIAMEELR